MYRRGRTWWIQIYHHNQRYRESSKSSRQADAVRILRKRLAEIGKGQAPGTRSDRLSLEDVARILLQDYAANERKTERDARRCMTKVQEHFGVRARAIEITADRLNGYVHERRKDGAAASTIRNELNALKRGLNLAVRAGLLAHRPSFPTIELRNTRTGFFEQDELDAVSEHLPEDVRPAIKFLYLTGWRVSEALPLRWSQVSFPAGVVRLEPGTTKNDEGRVFPFSALPALAEVLRQQRERTDAIERASGTIIPWVFHHKGETWMPKRHVSTRFRNAWNRACAAAEVRARILHDFRRTAVRNLERAGVPRSVAMKLTGHKTESVYRRYAIVSEADLAEGVAKLSRLHDALASPARPESRAAMAGKSARRFSGARPA